jgi:DNA primase
VPIPADLIERARSTPIESVAERHGLKLRRAGAERVGPCPICGGTDRFGVNTRKQVFLCRQCGAKGGAIDLEMFLAGSDFRAAVETLSGERTDAPAPAVLPAKPGRR